MARRRTKNLRYALLALLIAVLLWGMAHSADDVEQGFDIPVVFEEVPDDLVITSQSTDEINIRVLGSRAALRNVQATKLRYVVNVSGGRPGPFSHDVEARARLELPRGTTIVSRSPASIDLIFERKGRRLVRVREDIEGEPAPGYLQGEVVIDPPKVWLLGARSELVRLSEVLTETIDVTGATETIEREAAISLGGGHLWMEENGPVKVRIDIEPVEGASVEADDGRGGGA